MKMDLHAAAQSSQEDTHQFEERLYAEHLFFSSSAYPEFQTLR